MSARIATVGYLNTWPLSSKLDESRYQVTRDIPDRVATALQAGEADVALVPVAALFGEDSNWRIVPGFCIGAQGPVHSVVIAAETPMSEWTEVLLDGSSRTSAVLAQLLLAGPWRDQVRADLTVRRVEPGDGPKLAGGTVATLVIGDPARTLDARFTQIHDLAEAWSAWTNLPFVFAVWAGRPELDPEVVQHLRSAAHEGLAAVNDAFEGDDLRYLTESLRYTLDDPALMGLRRFAALAHKAGLFHTELVELYGPPSAVIPREGDVDATLMAAVRGETLSIEQAALLERHARIADLTSAATLVRSDRESDTDIEVKLAVPVGIFDDRDHLTRVLDEAVQEGFTEVFAQTDASAGLPTNLAFLGWLHTHWPQLSIRAFSPADIRTLGIPAEVLPKLIEAGLHSLDLDALPLLDADHPDVGVLRLAGELGLKQLASCAFGGSESATQRYTHLTVLRDLQAQCSPFYGAVVHTVSWRGYDLHGDGTAANYLRWTAMVRLFAPELRTYAAWNRESTGVAQAALHGGASALSPLQVVDEDWLIQLIELRRCCEHAGFALRTSREVPEPRKVRETARRRLGEAPA